jgi:hypothetical protein
MISEEIKEIEKAKAYLDGLAKYTQETNDDDWEIEFLKDWLHFKTTMSLAFNEAHKFGNKHMHQTLGL